MAYRKALDETFIEGTIQIVAETGIENTRTRQIADYTGFSEGTMFKKFPTKEILLRDTFLYIDKKIASIVLNSKFICDSGINQFEEGVHEIWHKIYRYLIEHKEETLFLIRYRYSAFCTDEVQEQMAYRNGSFDVVYEAFDRRFGEYGSVLEDLLVNCTMEITMCFVEKIIGGKLVDDLNTEMNIWMIVRDTLRSWNKNRGILVS